MKLFIDDKTNSAKPLYYQSLVLLFFPCERFGEKDDDNNKLFIDAFEKDGKYFATVKFEISGRVECLSDSEDVIVGKYSQMKNLIGRTLIRTAGKIVDTVTPWGISTGVKPVKLARMFVDSLGLDEAYNVLCNDYLIMPSKAKMAVNACLNEQRIMSGLGSNPCSLYISIPFCPTKCNYCSFVSCTTPKLLSLIPDYLSALKSELVFISETVKELGLDIKSIYVGGGTPAILDEKQIGYLLDSVHSLFDYDDKCEFTFEAGRPDCINFEKLSVLKDFGIERVSINTQTTNDTVLNCVGRKHTYSDYIKAMEMAKKIGFKCINTDLIAGLPGEDADSFKKSVRDVASLSPENLTIHAFTLKKASDYRIRGEKDLISDDLKAVEMSEYAFDYLSDAGYNPYYVYRQKNTVGNLENVGFSKCGHECIYNIIMMGEYHTVFGAGAGSVTKIVTDNANKVDRIFAPKYPYEFLDDTKYPGFDCNAVIDLLRER